MRLFVRIVAVAVGQPGICDMKEVEANQRPSRFQYPGRLGKGLLPADDVVQHRAGQDKGKPTIVERQVGGISLRHLDPPGPGAERAAGASNHLWVVIGGNHGQVGEPRQQPSCHGAATGTYFQELPGGA